LEISAKEKVKQAINNIDESIRILDSSDIDKTSIAYWSLKYHLLMLMRILNELLRQL